jgi:hypothetical protein
MIEKIMQKYETILFDNKKRKIFFVVVFILLVLNVIGLTMEQFAN